MKGETRLKAWIVGMAPLFFLPLYGALVGLGGYPMLVYTNFIHSLFGEYVGYLIIGITLAPFAFFDHEYPRFYKSFGKYSEKAKSWENFIGLLIRWCWGLTGCLCLVRSVIYFVLDYIPKQLF